MKLELTFNQIKVLEAALDFYVRTGLGQLERTAEVINELHGKFETEYENATYHALMEIKREVLGFHSGASHGIANEKVKDKVKVLYDLLCVLQKEIAEQDSHRHSKHSVWHNKPLHLGSEPLAKVSQ